MKLSWLLASDLFSFWEKKRERETKRERQYQKRYLQDKRHFTATLQRQLYILKQSFLRKYLRDIKINI